MNTPAPDSHTPRRPLKRRNIMTRGNRFGPNMTPMVDVVLVILIFFMAAATIAGHEWFLRTDLPEAQDPDLAPSGYALPTPVLEAQLYASAGRVLVRGMGGSPRPLPEFIEQISSMDAGSTKGLILRISTGDEVPYADLVALHEAAIAKGIRVALR